MPIAGELRPAGLDPRHSSVSLSSQLSSSDSILVTLTSLGPDGSGQGQCLCRSFIFPAADGFHLMDLCSCACTVTPQVFLQKRLPQAERIGDWPRG